MHEPKVEGFTKYRGYTLGGEEVVERVGKSDVTRLRGGPFDWGIDSDGARRLAAAILSDSFEVEVAEGLSVEFLQDVVLDLEPEWEFTSADLVGWLEGYDEE